MWSITGLALALAIAGLAWRRSLAPGSFYDAGVYGMTPQVHRRYAYAGVAFAAFFAVTFALRQESFAVAGFAAFALFAVFYGASFLRGAESDE